MALPADLQLTSDLAWCESIIRIHSGSFYRAFRQLPPEKAEAVFAVYAFCRIADDSIDVEHNPVKLQELAEKLERFAVGETPDEPLWRSLRWAFNCFPLDISPFREMLLGQQQDVSFAQPRTRKDLLEYCYLVAGTVGLMILPLLSQSITPAVRQTAIDLGVAMQLTNILRDIGADYRIGRIYLPADELENYGIPASDLGQSQPSPALRRYWLELADETLVRYNSIKRHLGHFDPEARLPITLALLYYSHITLLGIKRADHVLRQRMVVSNARKLWLLVQARAVVWWFNHRPEGQ